MDTNSPLPPADAGQPADNHLLEDLAAMTGLFNPEVLWHTEEKLDDLIAQDELVEKAKLQQSAPDTTESTKS
jgi:hypothetical protein